ncbi:hypothetical protein F4778DRAFT_749959 [Xylariomycetidae sp. FL2044]|nr:hypothetical protein F4778DRAFT_749959 [Xylariomycetidae sp. FL2044]
MTFWKIKSVNLIPVFLCPYYVIATVPPPTHPILPDVWLLLLLCRRGGWEMGMGMGNHHRHTHHVGWAGRTNDLPVQKYSSG